ncbi:glycosyltransferase family 2 protein [Numidum massiliense]|uniref:glycosyltransferase family 2 protein n=1 Tax=Numidum massiliense TaxID=1522315 RepID=UPI0006D53FC2|nr:glycosyltransferase family 2 protein [Numidum massiliense]
MDSKYIFSLILVVRNEIHYIERVLEAVLAQDFPCDRYEIIVVDGQSNDGTQEVIADYIKRDPSRMTYLTNPQRTLPTGWNMAIKCARGEYVVRVDGHSHISYNFLTKTYDVVRRHPEATCVGGVIETKGKGFWGEVNAYVYSHPFGVGNSKFRTTKGQWEGYVDTVPYGAYKRDVFERVGYFDESLKRNEDLEMHARIRRDGGQFFLSTDIRSTYYARSSLSGLVKKSFSDGKWTFVASRRGQGVLRPRHKIPLYVSIVGSILTAASFFSATSFWVLLSLAAVYSCLIGVAAAKLGKQKGARYFFACMIAFFLLHLSRGFGSAASYFSKDYWRGKQRLARQQPHVSNPSLERLHR